MTITPHPVLGFPRDLMTFVEVMKYLGKSRPFVYTLMARDGLPARRMGKSWVFSKAEVDAWIGSRPGVNLPTAV